MLQNLLAERREVTAPASARSRCTSPPGTCSARGGSRSPTTASAFRRAERHRVFEPLARVDDSIEGTGIGLATCRRIVDAHGGRIGLDATVTEGARFWFELPD